MDKDLCREAVNDFNKAYKEHDNDEQYAAFYAWSISSV